MLILLALLAQASPQSVPPSNVRVSFEQVKPDVSEPALNLQYPLPDRPIFRVHIEKRAPVFEPLWHETNGTPAWVRTKRPTVHHEFLAMVTPESLPFRSAVLYPCCIDIAPLLDYLGDQVTGAVRSHRQSEAKREVYDALLKAGFRIKRD